MHTWWNALRLSSLVCSHEISIENFKNKSTEIISVNCGKRVALDSTPARFRQFGRCISSRVWYQTSIILAQIRVMKTGVIGDTHTYITASSSFMLLSTSNPPTFHSPLSLVYIDPARIAPCTEDASSLINLIVCCPEVSPTPSILKRQGQLTATPKRPHFKVSVDMLFRLICHLKGTILSVAMYINVSVWKIIRNAPNVVLEEGLPQLCPAL